MGRTTLAYRDMPQATLDRRHARASARYADLMAQHDRLHALISAQRRVVDALTGEVETRAYWANVRDPA